jgi:hypothetical protein
MHFVNLEWLCFRWFGFGSTVSDICSDLFWMPSPSPVLTVLLTPTSGSILPASVFALASAGQNNVTLGRRFAFTQDLNFTVLAEDGTLSSSFTIRIVQVRYE